MTLSSKYLFESKFDPSDQIGLLKEKCNKVSSHLYKVNAFYLEELRNTLPQALRSSLFSLITDNSGDVSGFSTVSSRRRFQLKVDKLVSDNISILTIEHLIELAKKIDEENTRHLNNAKDDISNGVNLKNNSERLETSSGLNSSIKFSSIPPLENLSITEGWNAELKFPYSIDDKYDYILSPKSESYHSEKNINDEYLSLKDDEKNDNFSNLKSNEIEILQSFFSLADESSSTELDSKKEDLSNQSLYCDDLKNNRFLPQSPIGLYEWMISIDLALVRRLRDLSYSINIELLKSGLVNTLVPINILDAALSGQLVSSKSISNILTLKLPTNNSLGSGGLDIDCLLLTPPDMEFDNLRLRKNRTHIKYYQNVLLGMIKQQRYCQGRSIAEEVNKEWWKDTNKI